MVPSSIAAATSARRLTFAGRSSWSTTKFSPGRASLHPDPGGPGNPVSELPGRELRRPPSSRRRVPGRGDRGGGITAGSPGVPGGKGISSSRNLEVPPGPSIVNRQFLSSATSAGAASTASSKARRRGYGAPALINEMGIPEGYHSPRSDIDAHPADLIALGGDSGALTIAAVCSPSSTVYSRVRSPRGMSSRTPRKAASRRRAADDRPLFVASNLGKLLCRRSMKRPVSGSHSTQCPASRAPSQAALGLDVGSGGPTACG